MASATTIGYIRVSVEYQARNGLVASSAAAASPSPAVEQVGAGPVREGDGDQRDQQGKQMGGDLGGAERRIQKWSST